MAQDNKDIKALTLHVRVVEGKNLPAKDLNGKSDPYVKIHVGGDHLAKPNKIKPKLKEKTKTISETLFPLWNESFSFHLDNASGNIRFRCFDYDRAAKDDLIGCAHLSIASLVEKKRFSGWLVLLDKQGHSQGHIYVMIVADVSRAKLSKSALEQLRSNVFAVFEQAELKLPPQPVPPVKIFCGTWNVGNAPPPTDLTPWIPKRGYELFVIGVQESSFKPKDAKQQEAEIKKQKEKAEKKGSKVAPEPVKTTSEDDWDKTLIAHFKGEPYSPVLFTHLMQIRLAIFAHNDVVPRISNTGQFTEATGLAHVVGNKGGAVGRLDIDDLSLAFVSSHLAAHQGKTERRNADFTEIAGGIRLGPFAMDLLNQFHHVFWLGDLNYRLNYGDQKGESPTPELFNSIVKMLEEKKYDELFATDQLLAERKAGRAFAGFQEGAYRFPPTFKLLKGTDDYNPERSPAWCDRILWKSFAGFNADQTAFNSVPTIRTSDHKPVYGAFTVYPFLYPNGIDSKLGKCSLVIKNLKARGLPAADIETGSSDPYVKFYSNFIEGESIKTAHVNKNLNPDWKDKDVPAIPLKVNSPARLARTFIMLQCFDHDTVGSDDILADGVLSLDKIATAAPGQATHFQITVYAGGIPHGTLEGDATLQWAASSFKPITPAEIVQLGVQQLLAFN